MNYLEKAKEMATPPPAKNYMHNSVAPEVTAYALLAIAEQQEKQSYWLGEITEQLVQAVAIGERIADQFERANNQTLSIINDSDSRPSYIVKEDKEEPATKCPDCGEDFSSCECIPF